MEFSYDDLTCRNWPLITKEQQEKLKSTRVLIAGCGTGSLTAEQAVRMGFARLTVVDGDAVSITNMNRQAYDCRDVGQNKARATRKRLLRINPECQVKAVPEFLSAKNVEKLVTGCDIVVDAIDLFDLNAVLMLHKEAMSQNKPVVTGINLGWGAVGMVFTPSSMTIGQLISSFAGVPEDKLLDARIEDLMAAAPQALLKYLPSYFPGLIAELAKGPRVKDMMDGFPQPAVAAMQCVTFGIAALTRVALGLPVAVAPKPLYLDPWLALEPKDGA